MSAHLHFSIDSSNQPGFFVPQVDFAANAGLGISPGSADTDNHLHTFILDGANSSYSVSGIGTVTGDAGSEDYQFGTMFANTAGTDTINGSMDELIVYPRKLGSSEVINSQSFLTTKWKL